MTVKKVSLSAVSGMPRIQKMNGIEPHEKAPAMTPTITPRRSRNHLLPVVTALL